MDDGLMGHPNPPRQLAGEDLVRVVEGESTAEARRNGGDKDA